MIIEKIVIKSFGRITDMIPDNIPAPAAKEEANEH